MYRDQCVPSQDTNYRIPSTWTVERKPSNDDGLQCQGHGPKIAQGGARVSEANECATLGKSPIKTESLNGAALS